MEIINQGAREFLADGKASLGIQLIYLAFDIEDGADPFHGFQRDRRDLMGGLPLAHVARDICEFEELPAGMRPTQRTNHSSGFTVIAVKVVVSTIGIGLQDPLPSGEVLVGIGRGAIAGEVEDRRRRAPPFQGRSSRT